jgi:hypothetical protein
MTIQLVLSDGLLNKLFKIGICFLKYNIGRESTLDTGGAGPAHDGTLSGRPVSSSGRLSAEIMMIIIHCVQPSIAT